MLGLNKRKLKIVKILLSHSNGITGEEIAQLIGVSSRTVRSDIKKIQELLLEHDLKIISSPNRGYKMQGPKKLLQLGGILNIIGLDECVAVDTADERADYIVCRMLENTFIGNSITQMDLAEEMFIGISTLKAHFNDARKQLKRYSLDIVQYKIEGLKVYGQEGDIRYCISDYMHKCERSGLQKKVFSDISILKLDMVVQDVLNRRNLWLTDTAKANLCVHVALAIQRSKINKLVYYSATMAQKIEESFEYSVAKNIVSEIYQQLDVDVSYGDVYYIAQCLLTSKKVVNTDSVVNKAHVKELVGKILREVCDKLSLDFTEDQYLIDGLTLHLSIAIARVQFHMHIRNDLLETIKKDYPLAFQMGIITGKIITEIDNVIFNESEIGYIALHFGAAISRNGIKEGVQQKNVVIVCSAGLGVSLLLKAKVEEYFHNRIKVVKIIPGYEVDQTLVEEIDFVFTTVPLENVDSRKVVRINHMLKAEDISRVEQVVFSKPMLQVEAIEEFFSDNRFYIDRNFSTKDECINFLSDRAIEAGLMSNNGKLSVFERERSSSTAIGELTAIPHPIYNDTSSSFISVLVLNQPIRWDENTWVQVVFLLHIAKEKSALWEQCH